ncbi:MAG TPA: GntR family transcriptional regulator [Thermoanaerobacterales bacterium]|nr:GntR family transcriptional regulator [Thermoanaerobacterales bacterium]
MDFNHKTIKDNVAVYIRRMILSGELKPGDRIIPGDIAGRLHISRGPVREALMKLESEGLVRSNPYKGAFVTTMTEKQVNEVCSIRGLLEGYAVDLALPRITPEIIGHFENILIEMDESSKHKDIEGMVNCDIEFHSCLLKSTGHDLLYKIWADTNTTIAALFMTFYSKLNIPLKDVVIRHYGLLDAIKSKNAGKAHEAIVNHYVKMSESYTNLLRENKGELSK